ncbi:beta-1,6-N-acetylglucosaminyltransferase [Rhizobium sp. LjRoot254]|uniref:beta-1,6-N-acetylglucosaminyltransferase n=1 Tax=Rhizobium sp. LjRoot254 TaxID=3342297 RepID=UPI003ECEEB83
MAKITFIILAHENADHVADLASLLTEWDPHANAVIHYDLNSPAKQFERLKERTASSSRIHLVKERIKCGWGNFSLVDSVIRALKVVRREKIDCDRVMLISGACMPIRPLAEFSQFLDSHPQTEFIEAYDSNWMIGGLRKERYQYWHFFNHQTHQKLFNWHFQLQRIFWPKRRFPRALEPRFGSQWWCLSWKLCEKILDYIQKHPMVYFFFSTTWIPDEMFFQTMAFKFTHNDNLARRNLTFFHFNDWGKPIVLMDDHMGLIRDLPFFFARKVSSSAKKLRAHLIETAKRPAPEKPLKIDFSTRFKFPYKEMIAALPKASPLTPALFQHRNLGLWSDVLENCPQSFTVLYGPPQLTRRAADALRNVPGLTVLGRVLHPDRLDFGPGVTSFRGLHSDDNLIRDFDLPAYFGRILSRVDDMAVIELAPGDSPQGEMALMLSRNAVVLPVMPEHDNDVMRQLYWTLCVGGGLKAARTASPIDSFRSMQRAMDAKIPADYRLRTETYLKTANMTAETSVNDWQAALKFRHGEAVTPVTENLDKMEQAINAADIDELIGDLPDDWKTSVSMLSALHAHWRLLKLNFPVALPELFTLGLELQSNARHIGNADLTEESRGAGN